MAVLKLSQIAAAGSAPAATDQIVGVTTGTTDNLFSLTQINTSVLNTIGMAVGSAKITGGTNARILFDNAGVLGEYTAASANSFLGTATGTGANTDVAFWTGTSTLSGDAGFTYGGQGVNPMVTLALGTITTNVKALNITGTWNAAGVTFDAPLFMNITNTASAAGSKFVDWQIGGVSSLSFGSNPAASTNYVLNVNGATPTIGTVLAIKGVTTDDIFAIEQASGTKKWSFTVRANDFFFGEQGVGYRFGITAAVANQVGVTLGGNTSLGFVPGTGLTGSETLTSIDAAFFRDAAVGIIAMGDPASNTTATGFRVYNTTDNVGTNTAPTNYERFTHDWTTSANVATLGTQNGGTGSARAMNIITGGTNAITISTAQAVAFPGVGTTASAANAFLDNAASNNLLRSTSSLRYKTAVTGVPDERIRALTALRPIEFQSRASVDNPDTRFVGYAAEEVAEIDPTLVSLDKEGNPDSVMYDRVLLLKVAALEQTVKELQNR